MDQIYAEMLKADEQITATVLTDILRDIWESEEAPLSWKSGLIVKLLKKGDLTNCNNLRGIILLSVTYKVLSRVVLNRLSTTVDPLLRREQAGFRKGRGCADQIFTLRQIVEQSNERSSTVCMQTLLTLLKPLTVLTAYHFGEYSAITGSQTNLCPSSKYFTVIIV